MSENDAGDIVQEMRAIVRELTLEFAKRYVASLRRDIERKARKRKEAARARCNFKRRRS